MPPIDKARPRDDEDGNLCPEPKLSTQWLDLETKRTRGVWVCMRGVGCGGDGCSGCSAGCGRAGGHHDFDLLLGDIRLWTQ
jgi:hypothetical protein